MNKAKLAAVIREHADKMEGKEFYRSFGAPGDWGYGTPIGDAIAAKETA